MFSFGRLKGCILSVSKLTLQELLGGVETGDQVFRMIQVRRAVSQLAVALSQGGATEAAVTWTDRNP